MQISRAHTIQTIDPVEHSVDVVLVHQLGHGAGPELVRVFVKACPYIVLQNRGSVSNFLRGPGQSV